MALKGIQKAVRDIGSKIVKPCNPIKYPSPDCVPCANCSKKRIFSTEEVDACCPPATVLDFGSFDGSPIVYSNEMDFHQWCQTSLFITFQYSGGGRDTRLFYNLSGQGYSLIDYTSTVLFDINNNTIDTLSWSLESTTPIIIEIFAENVTCGINYGKVGQLQIV